MDIGMRIDALYNLRAQRLALAKQVDELEMKEKLEKEAILKTLWEMGLAKASGSLATVGRVEKVIPIVTDWDKVFEYMSETKQWDLVQRRIGVLAWKARDEDGILVPGTERGVDISISLTKSSRG